MLSDSDEEEWRVTQVFNTDDFGEGHGPLPEQDSANELPDTGGLHHRNFPSEEEVQRVWDKNYSSNWSSPELRRVRRLIHEEYHWSYRDTRPDFHRLDRIASRITMEMKRRYLDPTREQRVVTQQGQATPAPPPPQQRNLPVYEPTRDIHMRACPRPRAYHMNEPAQGIYMQGHGRPRIQHVYEQAPPINVRSQEPPPVRVVHHRLPPRVIFQGPSRTTIQRSGTARPYERPGAQPEDVEFRPRLIERDDDEDQSWESSK
jgi:hypothetical protein